MTMLKSLTLTQFPKQEFGNPVVARRAKLIARIEEQKALLADPLYMAVDQKWMRSPDGRKELVARKRKVRRWWREDATGAIYIAIKYGQKRLEIEKGKPAIAVANKQDIGNVLDVLIEATRAGELDSALQTMSRARPVRKTTK
jgi:hypothetical protein